MKQALPPVIIIGAGPAGLAAAHECLKLNLAPVVFEASPNVGGISRTENYKEYLFDIGGHRFFSRMENINTLWGEMMGSDFLTVSRISRIYYNGTFFDYPLKPANALANLGIIESLLILCSYIKVQIKPLPVVDNFEQWVVNRFGWRLYNTFFKSYTEKVWGIPCSEILAVWASQRIKGLSLKSAVVNAVFGGSKPKSLIDSFNYPVRGPGMMWKRFQESIEKHGGKVNIDSQVLSLNHENGRVTSIVHAGKSLRTELSETGQVISSIPVSQLIKLFEPPPPQEVLTAADALSYRSFLIVGLIINRDELFPDQWIYIHSPDVSVGRIQNFKNWSAAMVPDASKSSIGMEYFCTIGDTIWQMDDKALIALATKELAYLGLVDEENVVDGVVIRQPRAYPVYDNEYEANLFKIRQFIDTISNLQTIGRNGMHRYNNMDHSMQTGIMAAKNVAGDNFNLWEINEDDSYLEEEKPAVADSPVIERWLFLSFARMDKFAFATSCGTLASAMVFVATIWLLCKGGVGVGQHLKLIGQYFIGYTVTVEGAFLASGYAFFTGFLLGWSIAYLRNMFIALYLNYIKKRNELLPIKDLIDHI